MTTLSLETRFDNILEKIITLENRFKKIEEGKSQYSIIASVQRNAFHNEELLPNPLDDEAVLRCKKACNDLKLETAKFHYVSKNYYQTPLEARRDVLKAPSVHHLCKSIILENTHCTRQDCSDPKNSRFYIIMLQYTRKLDADKITDFIRDMNTIGKKNFVFRLAEEIDSDRLSGFKHNGVTPLGMLTNIPLIFDSSIFDLKPEVIWFGGGHVDVKLQVDLDEIKEKMKPLVASVTVPK